MIMHPPLPAPLDALRHGTPADLGALRTLLGRHLPLLARMEITPQEPEWHGEGDVATHTALVVREAEALMNRNHPGPERRLILLLGALLHDIGKVLTTREEVDDTGRLRVVSPHHAERGRSYAAYRMGELGLEWAEVWSVLGLIGHHHQLTRTAEDGSAAAYARLARQVDLELLTRLEQADVRGRITAGQQDKLEWVELFALGALEHGVFGDAPYAGWAEHVAAHVPDHPGLRDLTLGRGVQAFEAGLIHTPDEAVARAHDARNGFPELVVTVAPSGSGKSTYVREHFPDHEVISLDALREELGNDASSQKLNGQVMQLGRERLRAALRRGRRVVWDATSLRKDFRRTVLGLGHDYGALTTLLAWTTPEHTAQRRNAERKRTVPANVIGAQYDSAEFPHLTEAHRTRVLDADGRTLAQHGFLE